MQKFILFLADFFRDRNDGSSYKRLTGFLCFAVAVVVAFTTQNQAICSLFLGVSLGEGIATVFEKDKP
jgi:hypothetical protein